jgi:hypothetical protein
MTENERQTLGDGLDDILFTISATFRDCSGYESRNGEFESYLREGMIQVEKEIIKLQAKLGVAPA